MSRRRCPGRMSRRQRPSPLPPPAGECCDDDVRNAPDAGRVRDVMTTKVATADRNMPYKQAAKLMTDQRVTAIPIVSESGRVVGIVSEADLLHKVEPRPRGGTGLSGQARRDRAKARARTAGELMTSPAITIDADASLSGAAG